MQPSEELIDIVAGCSSVEEPRQNVAPVAAHVSDGSHHAELYYGEAYQSAPTCIDVLVRQNLSDVGSSAPQSKSLFTSQNFFLPQRAKISATLVYRSNPSLYVPHQKARLREKLHARVQPG